MRIPRSLLAWPAAALAAGAALAGTADAHAERRFPARMLVYAREWSLSPSRATLPAGRVVVQLWNRGMDAHDLRIRRLNRGGAMVGATQGVRVTSPGAISSGTWTLGPGPTRCTARCRVT